MGKIFTKKVSLVLLIVLAALGYFGYRSASLSSQNVYTVAKGLIVQKVSETGRIVNAKDFDLSYGVGGEVSRVYAEVGDRVEQGAALTELDRKELEIQLRQAQARRATVQAKLDQLLAGAKPEDIQVYETAMDNAETALRNAKAAFENAEVSLSDARTNLENVKTKAEADLGQAYSGALAALQKAVVIGKTALITLSNIQYAHFTDTSQESIRLIEAKAVAVEVLLGVPNAGRYTAGSLSQLDKGVFGMVQDAVYNPAYESIDIALLKVSDALQKVKQALEAVPVVAELTAAENINLNTEKSNVSTEIIAVSESRQAIGVQNAVNENRVSAAQEKFNTAQSALDASRGDLKLARGALETAKNELAFKEAGPREVDTAVYQSQVQDAQGAVELLEKQLQDTALRAPAAGIITRVSVEKGERVAPNQVIVSLMSRAYYELEVYIAEENIAGIALGMPIEFTLDAFSKNSRFKAQVALIEPVATIIEDEVYYKVKGRLQEDIVGVREGMTADADIILVRKSDVLLIPEKAVKEINGQRFVLVKKGWLGKEPRSVELGARGNGLMEVKQGLAEGEKVLADFAD